MRRQAFAYATIVMSVGLAQAASQPPGGNSSPTASMPMSGYTMPLANADMEKLRSKLSEAERAKLRAQAIKESGALVSAIHLACDVTDAQLIGSGKVTAGGKTTDVTAYEIACRSRLGYFVESLGAQTPIAISCFAVDAAHSADLAQGKQSDSICALASNKDVKASAAVLLSDAGATCGVKTVRWLGLSSSSQTEYTETACDDGNGYLLKVVRSGATTGVSALSCQDAAKQGLQCHLTDGGPVSAPITMQTYREALKQHAAACEPMQMRVIGRESEDKRYVVEVRCSGATDGMVAFIPLAGNEAPFEMIDCAAAVEREIRCELGTQKAP